MKKVTTLYAIIEEFNNDTDGAEGICTLGTPELPFMPMVASNNSGTLNSFPQILNELKSRGKKVRLAKFIEINEDK